MAVIVVIKLQWQEFQALWLAVQDFPLLGKGV
jgi:hypothetical protein